MITNTVGGSGELISATFVQPWPLIFILHVQFTVSNVSYFTTYLNVKSFTFMKSFKSLKTTVDRNE